MVSPEQLFKHIGTVVRSARQAKGLTLLDVEVLTDISKRQLIKIEQGQSNVSAYSLHKLVTVLEIDTVRLLLPE